MKEGCCIGCYRHMDSLWVLLFPFNFSHWMGLSHVYTGGCEQGDRVSDTPASALPNFGCNPAENRDTCPLEQGLDPIFNFMDAR